MRCHAIPMDLRLMKTVFALGSALKGPSRSERRPHKQNTWRKSPGMSDIGNPGCPKTPVNIHHACRPRLCPPMAECLKHHFIQGRNGIAFRVRESIIVDCCNGKCFQDRDLSNGTLSIYAQTISACPAHLGTLIALKFAGDGWIWSVSEYPLYVRSRPHNHMDSFFLRTTRLWQTALLL